MSSRCCLDKLCYCDARVKVSSITILEGVSDGVIHIISKPFIVVTSGLVSFSVQ